MVLVGALTHPVVVSGSEDTNLTTEQATKDYTEAVEEAIDKASQNIKKDGVNSEWEAIGLTQAGKKVPEGYNDVLSSHIQEQIVVGLETSRIKITDIERLAMATVAIGKDPQEIDDLNLIEHIYNSPEHISGTDAMTLQGNNGPIFALIALDTINFDVPDDAKWTRQKLIDELLSTQNEDGSWSLNDILPSPSVDITAMALIGLSPYKNQPKVESALDEAVAWLSSIQTDNGGFDGGDFVGGITSEAASQVMIGLTAYGINPTNKQFTKNGNDLMSHLLEYQNEDGGFKHTHDYPNSNAMATEQALQALVAYKMFLNGEGSLYNFKSKQKPEPPKDETPPLITVRGISDDQTVSTSEMTFSVEVKDNKDKILTPAVKINDTNVSPNEDKTYTVTLNEGMNTITVAAEDKAGNHTIQTYHVIYQAERSINVGDEYQIVKAKEKLVIGDTKVVLPDNLPEGTEMKVTNYDAEKGNIKGIEKSGDVLTFDFQYPEGVERPDNFELTMGINKDVDIDKTAIYYYNEESGKWDYVEGNVDDEKTAITVNVDHFSTYGVFTDDKGPTRVKLSKEKTTSNSITLGLSANDPSGIKKYIIYRDGKEIDTIDGHETEYTDKDLNADQTYEYNIAAFDGLGNKSKKKSITLSTNALEKVKDFKVTIEKTTADSITLGWSANDLARINEYIIYRNGEEIDIIDGKETTYTDTDLKADQTYEYSIVALDELGNELTKEIVPASTIENEKQKNNNVEEIVDRNDPAKETEDGNDLNQKADKTESSNKLPETATNIFNFLLIGTGLIVIGLVVLAFYIRKRKYTTSN